MLFNITKPMLDKYPETVKELVRIERIKQQKYLLETKKRMLEEIVSYISKRVIWCICLLFVIVWMLQVY